MLLIILNSELNRSYTLDLFIYMRFCIVLIHFSQRLKALDGKRRFALAAAASHKEEVGRLRYVSHFKPHFGIKSEFNKKITGGLIKIWSGGPKKAWRRPVMKK